LLCNSRGQASIAHWAIDARASVSGGGNHLNEPFRFISTSKQVLDFIHHGGPPPEPTPIVRISAAVNGPTGDFFNRDNTISELAWADDAQSLTFLGRSGRENRQLFRVAIATGTLTAISPPDIDVPAYAAAGRSLGFLA
jgi:hypothetical protein